MKLFHLFGQIKSSLERQASILQSLQDGVVRRMEMQVQTLDRKTKALQENLKFNHSSLDESVNLILLEVIGAQEYLNTIASKEIKNVCGLNVVYKILILCCLLSLLLLCCISL